MVKLAKAPGAREQRWAHLLCGPVDATLLASASTTLGCGRTAESNERIERLETEVAQLRDVVQRLCAELVVSPA